MPQKLVTRLYMLAAALVLAAVLIPSAALAQRPPKDAKLSGFGVYEGYYAKKDLIKKFDLTSQYLPMRDGVRIAIDTYVPASKGKTQARFPVIFYQTRYQRRLEIKAFFRPLAGITTTNIPIKEIRWFVEHGYAVVVADVRGSGASFGNRPVEFGREEVKDGGEIVDWIVKQPWSNGAVGSTGVSYPGTTALMLPVNQHPAVKVIIPRHAIWDVYSHITNIGGIQERGFMNAWGITTQNLDSAHYGFFSKEAKVAVKGPHPVDGDKGGVLLRQAIAEHKGNFDIIKETEVLINRDDASPYTGIRVDESSAHNYAGKICGSPTKIYWLSGWYDGNVVSSSIEGYNTCRQNSIRMVIGPWDHGPVNHVSPYRTTPKVEFAELKEFLRVFDHYLKGWDNGVDRDAPVYYYTFGAEVWRTALAWDADGDEQRSLYILPGGKAGWKAPAAPGRDAYTVDYTATTGGTSRYNSVTTIYRHGDTGYYDRTTQDTKNKVYDTEPLTEDTEITGHPQVSLTVDADAANANVFVYLEEVLPDGKVNYITEGMLQAQHRATSPTAAATWLPGPYHTYTKAAAQPLTPGQPVKLDFTMIATSYLVKKGNRLRISIAGADEGHFGKCSPAPSSLGIHYGGATPSRVLLPIVKR